MWLLCDSANKQNKSIIHKTSLDYANFTAEEIAKQHVLKYTVDQLENLVETIYLPWHSAANKLLHGLSSKARTFELHSRCHYFDSSCFEVG